MIRSALLRRVYMVLLLAIFITALSTWLLFLLTSRSVFVNLRVNELAPRAQSLAKIIANYIDGKVSDETVLSLVDVNDDDSSIMNAFLIVTDTDGNVLLDSSAKKTINTDNIKKQLTSVLSGSSTTYVVPSAMKGDIVTIGMPVINSAGAITGAMFLYMPQYEALAARGALAGALAMSLAVVVPIVFILVYALLYRLVSPLRQMRDVALHMADGHFDKLANEDSDGEIGQLGSSLNRLSRTLKRTISALTFERNRLVQVLNGLSEGIAAIDQLGNITHINPALEELFSKGDKNPDPRMRVIPRSEIWTAFDAAVNEGTYASFTIRDGEMDIRSQISPVHDDDGNIAGAVGLFRDITGEVRLENTRREFVANVSHEMRTPLTAMRGLIEPLRDGLVTSEDSKKRYYDIILREVLRLSRLINDLMELSRLQSGNMALAPEVFSLDEILSDLSERYSSACAEHGLNLTVDSDFSAFPQVYSNPDRIEQLLVILLDNAIKYTPSGGRVTIGGTVGENKVILSVSDTGLGISPENLAHVFDRFYKVDKAHTGLGSGLGLSIAKEMLEQMGERIWAESEEGKGSMFSFTVKRSDGVLSEDRGQQSIGKRYDNA